MSQIKQKVTFMVNSLKQTFNLPLMVLVTDKQQILSQFCVNFSTTIIRGN